MVSSGLLIMLMITLGRIAGFVREAVLVGLFGLSDQADIAVLSLTLPDMLVGLLISGGFSAALIPEFKARRREAGALFWQASLVAGASGLVIALSMILWGRGWVSLLAPGLAPAASALAGDAFAVVAWAVPLAALSGVTTAYLNARERFGLAAAGTLIFNGVVIAGLLLSLVVPVPALSMLVGAVVVAAAMRWLPQLVAAGALGARGVGTHWLITGPLLRRYAYGVAAGSAMVLLPLVARALASLGESGAITAVNLSIKLVDLPLGAAIAVLPTLFLPRLAEKFLDPATREEGHALLALALRLGLAVMVAVTLPAILFMPSLVELLLGHGEMNADEVARVSELARLAFCYFPFQALILIMAAGFNANRDTWIPMLINGAVLLVFVVLGGATVGELGEAGIMMGLVGAYVVSAVLSLLSFALRYGTNLLPHVFPRGQLIAMIVAIAVFAAFAVLSGRVPEEHLLPRAVLAVVSGGVLLMVMVAGSREARNWVRRRLGRV